jgi:hypothetical protein
MMTQMLIGSGDGIDVVALVGGSVTSNALPLSACTSTYRLTSAGIEQAIITGVGAGTTDLGNWVTPTSHASLYEVMVTILGGTLTGGSSATGSWIALSSTRSWGVTATSGTTKLCDISVEIRDTLTSTVRATASVTLEAFA